MTTDPFTAKVLADAEKVNEVLRADLALLGRASISLTPEQAAVIFDANPPNVDNLPAWVSGVEALCGMPIRTVDLIKESLPYCAGWIADTARHIAHPELPDHTPE